MGGRGKVSFGRVEPVGEGKEFLKKRGRQGWGNVLLRKVSGVFRRARVPVAVMKIVQAVVADRGI